MKIPGEYFEGAMTPLVGSDRAVAAFEADLTATIGDCASAPHAYDRLETEAMNILHDSIAHASQNATRFKEKLHWGGVRLNGDTGVRLTVAATRAVGDAYREHASVPQEEASVAQNLDRILRYTFGIALTGRFVGSVNVTTMEAGIDPRPFRNWPAVLWAIIMSSPKHPDIHKGIVTAVDESTGQLDIRPHHRNLGKVRNRQCPASYTRVGGAEGHTRPALWTFMNAIGDVALHTIYPAQFDIMPSSRQP